MKSMRYFLFAGAAAAMLSAVGYLPQSRSDEKDEGWIQLFNGKDLTGWKMFDPPSGEFKELKEVKNDDGKVTAYVGVTKKDGKEITLWQVKDGTIVGGGPSSHLFTEIEAENFRYRVEAKINDKGNSGQYFRTKFGPGFPAGYEAQINATH
jgi:3-keto-disaccharide hydrolase